MHRVAHRRHRVTFEKYVEGFFRIIALAVILFV